MRENVVEKHFKKQVEGTLGGISRKHVSPGRKGGADQLAFLPLGRLVLAELKAPGKKPSRLQANEHARLQALGFTVVVLDTIEKVDAWVADELALRAKLAPVIA